MRISAALLIPILCLACGPSEPTTVEPAGSTTTPPPTLPPEAETEPEPSKPVFEIPGDCQVLLQLEAEGANGKLAGPITLRANAKNLTDAPLELTLPDQCPGGEAQFSGLESPEGSYYDYYGTCAMGACAGGRPPRVFALPPGEVVTISSVDINPAGEAPCNEPLAAGSYELSFALNSAVHPGNPILCGPEPLVLSR